MKKQFTIFSIIYILAGICFIIWFTFSLTSDIWIFNRDLGSIHPDLLDSFIKEKFYSIFLYSLILIALIGFLIRKIIGWGITIHLFYFYFILNFINANAIDIGVIIYLSLVYVIPIVLMNTKLILDFYLTTKINLLTKNMIVIIISLILIFLTS